LLEKVSATDLEAINGGEGIQLLDQLQQPS
jgi:hypothetical protein